MTHIAVTDWLTDGITEAATGKPADALSVTVDGFTAKQHDIGIIGHKAGEPLLHTAFELPLDRRPPLERRGPACLHRPAEPSFDGRVIRTDIRTPGAIALFQPAAL